MAMFIQLHKPQKNWGFGVCSLCHLHSWNMSARLYSLQLVKNLRNAKTLSKFVYCYHMSLSLPLPPLSFELQASTIVCLSVPWRASNSAQSHKPMCSYSLIGLCSCSKPQARVFLCSRFSLKLLLLLSKSRQLLLARPVPAINVSTPFVSMV